MRRLNNRSTGQSSQITGNRWIETFIKLHGQKQEIAKSPTESIELRVANFEQMLKLTAKQKIGRKLLSKSTFDFESIFKSSVANFLKLHQSAENSGHRSSSQRQIDSEQVQLKKFDKMATGLLIFEQQQKQKIRAQNLKKEELAKKQTQQGSQHQIDSSERKVRNIHTAGYEKKIPFPTAMAKTQKSWHQLKKIELKMQEKNIFIPLSVYSSQKRFKDLKKTVKQLENRAKDLYDMRFKKHHRKDPEYVRDLQQINEKQKALEQKFLRKRNVSNSFDNFVEEATAKLDDNSVPKFLMENKKKANNRLPLRRIMSSTVRREFIRVI